MTYAKPSTQYPAKGRAPSRANHGPTPGSGVRNAATTSQHGLTGLSLGANKTLVSADDLWRRFAPLGWSKVAFLRHLNALGVPWLYAPGRRGVRLIWYEAFQLALLCSLSIGMPNFIGPGSRPMFKPLATRARYGVRALDPAVFAQRWQQVLGILLTSDRIHLSPRATEVLTRDAYSLMAERISLWLAMFSDALAAKAETTSRAHLRRNGPTPPIPFPSPPPHRGPIVAAAALSSAK